MDAFTVRVHVKARITNYAFSIRKTPKAIIISITRNTLIILNIISIITSRARRQSQKFIFYTRSDVNSDCWRYFIFTFSLIWAERVIRFLALFASSRWRIVKAISDLCSDSNTFFLRIEVIIAQTGFACEGKGLGHYGTTIRHCNSNTICNIACFLKPFTRRTAATCTFIQICQAIFRNYESAYILLLEDIIGFTFYAKA